MTYSDYSTIVNRVDTSNRTIESDKSYYSTLSDLIRNLLPLTCTYIQCKYTSISS